jgi:hypothetical protein
MADRQHVLVIATGYEHMALRLLSALIQGWDAVPLATQGWILRDAALMVEASRTSRLASGNSPILILNLDSSFPTGS